MAELNFKARPSSWVGQGPSLAVRETPFLAGCIVALVKRWFGLFGTRPECIFGKLVVTSSRLAQSFPDFSSGMAGYPTGQQPLVSGTPHFLGLAVAAALGLRVRFFSRS